MEKKDLIIENFAYDPNFAKIRIFELIFTTQILLQLFLNSIFVKYIF